MINEIFFIFCLGNIFGLMFAGIQAFVGFLYYCIILLANKFNKIIKINYWVVTLISVFIAQFLIYLNYLNQTPVNDIALVINTFLYGAVLGTYLYHKT